MRRSELELAMLVEAQRIVRMAAGPFEIHDNVKSAIARAARRLGLEYRRARSFWYADPQTALRAVEIDRLRAFEVKLLREQRLRLLTEVGEIETRLKVIDRDG